MTRGLSNDKKWSHDTLPAEINFLTDDKRYSFVLSHIDFIFGMVLLWDNKHQPHTSLL